MPGLSINADITLMNLKTKQGILYFTTVTIPLLFFLYYQVWAPTIVFGFCVFMGIMVILFPNSKMKTVYDEFYDARHGPEPRVRTKPKEGCLTYHGHQLDFHEEDIKSILKKHSTFYSSLDDPDKRKFIKRLTAFIDDKIFKIHDKSGFREMPVLISSTAIQLSFGLDKYMLPHFTYINIHPEAFLGIHPTIRFLAGNVSGNSINISWKYFLHGFLFPEDGKNVGLHEMAHAYHYQNFGPCEIKDRDFVASFNKFNECGNHVFTNIQGSSPCLYSDYAKKNFQEFWAESIELFFEKPIEVRTTYPVLYESICDVLNQDPVKKFI